MMFQRHLFPSRERSFFLFGARGTGKTTFLRSWFQGQDVLWIDLLDPVVEDRYARRPKLLSEQIEARGRGRGWVIIDEIQKVPKLLDVVHAEIERSGTRFALTGSSARKLKRGSTNLLAGRAFVYHLFPFTAGELGDSFDLQEALEYGTLPGHFELQDPRDKAEFLRAYALTYLKEEVWAEHLIRNLDPFRAFLEVAAQCDGEIINYTKIGRDVGVDPKTIQSYFQILEDTLLAHILEPYHRSVRKRQSKSPRFYFIDTGVSRALSRTLNVPLNPGTYAYGRAFEHLVITEIFRRCAYLRNDFRLSYLRTKDGAELDLIVERPGLPTALIEIKSSTRVDVTGLRHLKSFRQAIPDSEAFCLSQEAPARVVDGIRIMPWLEGLAELGL
ncbi:MAG TPA: ATP-binding protein [Planctomycetaceae bacterium]|nr:ATP-binding protein [Planctomycetaceae bacterium]